MSLATLVYARLSTTAPLTTLVSTRITPEIRASGSVGFPAVVYGIESVTTSQAYRQASYFQAEVEILSLSKTKSQAEQVAGAVFDSLERYVGEDASIRILSCIHSRSTDGYLSPEAGDNLGVFTASDIFSVLYSKK